MRRKGTWVVAAGVLAACGCGGGPKLAPVSGVVKLDGAPLAGAAVQFQPVSPDGQTPPGPGSYGKTDADGRYSLKTVDRDRAGAVVGTHRVSISIAQESSDDAGRPVVGDKVPSWYNKESALRREVPAGGSSQMDFDLSSKKP